MIEEWVEFERCAPGDYDTCLGYAGEFLCCNKGGAFEYYNHAITFADGCDEDDGDDECDYSNLRGVLVCE